MPNILIDYIPVNRLSKPLICFHKVGQILPSPGSHKGFSVHGCLHPVKMMFPNLEVSHDSRMNSGFVCIFFPDLIVSFHIDQFDPV